MKDMSSFVNKESISQPLTPKVELVEHEKMIKISQRVDLPSDFDPFSQIVKLRLTIPKITLIGKNMPIKSTSPSPLTIEPTGGETCENIKSSTNELTDVVTEKLTNFFENREYNSLNYRKYALSLSSSLPKSSFEKLYRYLERSLEDVSDDSKIVKELVMNRYREAFNRYLEKSSKRRSMSRVPPQGEMVTPIQESVSRATSCEKDVMSVDTANVSENSYNMEANSVGTSELSQLVSCPYDLYASIDYSAKKKRQSSPINSYVSVDVIKEQFEETVNDDNISSLMAEMEKQSTILVQVSKALNLCDKVNCIERVEAERILLIATRRKEILFEQLTNPSYEDVNERKFGYLRISDVKIPLICQPPVDSKYSRYFVCLFRCGTKIEASDVVAYNGDTNVLHLKNCFYFEELPDNFEITVQIYSLYAKIGRDKPSKECTDVVQAFKKMFSPKKKLINVEYEEFRRPSFILYGTASITRDIMKRNEFKIRNIYPTIPVADILRCRIDAIVLMKNDLSGFLTVGERINGLLMWNRQWAKLETSELKFWDYPDCENDKPPTKIIVLSGDVTITESNRKTCNRPRTISISIQTDNNVFQYYLSADNQTDYVQWLEELKFVRNILQDWL